LFSIQSQDDMSNEATISSVQSHNNQETTLVLNSLKRKIPNGKGLAKRRVVVRRTHSPKNTPSAFFPPILAPPSKNTLSNVDAVLVPPTVQGISEAARSSIVAFPTETVYLVGCRAQNKEAIQMLMLVKEQLQGKSHQCCPQIDLISRKFMNPPVLCINSIEQVKEIIHFNPPKSYALVKPQPASPTPSSSPTRTNVDPSSPLLQQQMLITRFSEGKIVLNRLVSNFWPGPFVIFVPTKDDATTRLPSEILIKVESSGSFKSFVGLRCPSHPLARRLIKATKNPIVTFSALTSADTTSVCSSAAEVQTALQRATTSRKLIVPCINGEDKREVFAVPTCELGIPSTVVLIEEGKRQIHILRNEAANKITPTDIQQALLRNCNADIKEQDQRYQTLRAVLMKWKVIQHEV